MTAEIIQLSIPGMAGTRRPSSPKAYRDALIGRTRSMREEAGLSREDVAKSLDVKLDTYKRWENDRLLPHHLIIEFCNLVGADPYELLTGEPYRIGKRRPTPTLTDERPRTRKLAI